MVVSTYHSMTYTKISVTATSGATIKSAKIPYLYTLNGIYAHESLDNRIILSCLHINLVCKIGIKLDCQNIQVSFQPKLL